ncbi:hypothetical protein [Streptomyces sparsogenes]|uniref:hypothetical protein n=1 Tax=Streptomyces sparsogenes TaxID=67365 RepID=UPI003D9E2AD5
MRRTTVGTAGGITLGLTASIGGLASPGVGALADATSLRSALAPLALMPMLSRGCCSTLPEPGVPQPPAATPEKGDGTGAALSANATLTPEPNRLPRR